MKDSNFKEISDIVKSVDKKMEVLEDYMKLLLVNNIICEIDETTDEIKKDEILHWLNQNALRFFKYEKREGFDIYYFSFENKAGINEIREIMPCIMERFGVIPVVVLEKIRKDQRKKMIEEKWSYWIPEKELHIFYYKESGNT